MKRRTHIAVEHTEMNRRLALGHKGYSTILIRWPNILKRLFKKVLFACGPSVGMSHDNQHVWTVFLPHSKTIDDAALEVSLSVM